MKVYIVEIQVGSNWEPTGPNWWFTKTNALNAIKAFKAFHPDQKYRVGTYAAA